MSKNNKFGLLNILLTEQSGDEIGNKYTSEFFEMYFNGHCEDVAEFLISQFEKSKVSWDHMIELQMNGLVSTMEYELFRHFPDKMEETFKDQMRYDYDPEKEEFERQVRFLYIFRRRWSYFLDGFNIRSLIHNI